jgi:hypothetical protein
LILYMRTMFGALQKKLERFSPLAPDGHGAMSDLSPLAAPNRTLPRFACAARG